MSTKKEVVAELVAGASLSTRHVKILGLPFETFLRFCQVNEETRKKFVAALISEYGE